MPSSGSIFHILVAVTVLITSSSLILASDIDPGARGSFFNPGKNVNSRCNQDLLKITLPEGSEPTRSDRMRKHDKFAEELKHEGSQLQLVMYGDSQVGHLRELSDVEWNDLYGQYYRAEAFGIAGVGASELLWRLQNGEFPGNMTPQAVVILIGINDVLRAYHPGINEEGDGEDKSKKSPVETIEKLTESQLTKLTQEVSEAINGILIKIHQTTCDAKVAVLGLLPASVMQEQRWPSRYTPSIISINKQLKETVGRFDFADFVDCGEVFVSEDGDRIDNDLMPDGVHPSAKGHQLLSSCVLASVDNLTGHDRQLKGKEMVVEAIKADDSTIMPSLDAKAQQEHMVNLKDADSADAYKEAERVEQVPQHSVPSSPPTGPLVPWAESGSSFKGLQDHRPELGEWSSCSKSCGVGMRRREVRCNTANGQVQADTVPCPHSFEAWELQQPCNLLPCNLLPDTAPPAVVSTEAHWVPGAWMECQDEGCSKGNLVRNVICVDSAGQAIVDDEFAAMACGSLIKPKDNIALAKPLDICSRKDPAGLEAESRPCSGHGTCVSQSFEAEQGGILTKSSCVCEGKWRGPLCNIPLTCKSGVVDGSSQCCDSGVVSSDGQCCEGPGAELDRAGKCCSGSRKLDACGRCIPKNTRDDSTIDITGVCCAVSDISSSGFCCLKDEVDECGVCGGNGASCALRATGVFEFPIEQEPSVASMANRNMKDLLILLTAELLQDVGGIAVKANDVQVLRINALPDSAHLLQMELGAEDDMYLMGRQGSSPAPNASASETKLWNVSLAIMPQTRQEHGYRLTKDYFHKVWARGAESPALPFQAGLLPFPVVSRTGVCGNSVCEVGELVTASEDYCPGDCPDVSDHISCPVPSHAPSSTETTAVGDPERQCNGRGTCIPLARSCDCFVGYAGAECTSCAEGFVPISNTQHRGQCVNESSIPAMIGTSAFRGPQTPNRASLKDGEVALVLVEGAEDEVGRPEGSSDDWLNVFTKYFPFIVVTLIVLVTTSCIVVAACIYVSYRCKSLPLRSSACDSEPALLLYNNYAFKPKGVRLEDFCDDPDTLAAKQRTANPDLKLSRYTIESARPLPGQTAKLPEQPPHPTQTSKSGAGTADVTSQGISVHEQAAVDERSKAAVLPVQAERFAPAGIADVAVDISPEDTTEDAANMRRNLFEIGQQLDVSLDISAISQSNYGSNSMFDIADIVYEESSQQVETPAPLDCCAITNARCGPSASYPESGDTEYPCPCPVENSYLEISTPHTAEDTTTGTSTSCAGSCELETKQPHQREGNHPPCGDAALDNDTAGNQLKLSKDLVSTSPSAEASECSGRSADRATERVSTMLQGTEDTGAIADGIQDNPPSAASMSDLSSQSRRKPPAEPADSPLEGNKLARVFGGRACAPTAGQISMPASKPSPDQSAASDDMSTLHEHEASAGKKNHPFAAVIGLQITAGTPEMRIEVEPGPQYGAGPLGSSSSPQKSGQQAEQKRISEPFVDPPGGSSRMAYREGGQSATSMAEHDSGGHPKCATMEITIPVPRNANSLAEQADVTITGWPCNDLEKSPGLQEAKEPATGASGTERAVHCLAAQHDLQETIPESDDPLHMLMDIPTGTQPTGQNQQAAATGSAESSTACPSSDPFAGLFDIPVSHLTAEALYQP